MEFFLIFTPEKLSKPVKDALFISNLVINLVPVNLMSFKGILQQFLFNTANFSSLLLPLSQLFIDLLLPSNSK